MQPSAIIWAHVPNDNEIQRTATAYMACWGLLCNRAEKGYVYHNSSPTTWPWSHHYAHLTGKDTKTQRSEINCPRVIQFLSGPPRTFQVCWAQNLSPSAHCLRWGLLVTELPPTTASRLSNQLPEHTGARQGQQGIDSITVESHQTSYRETQLESQSPMFAEENSRKALSISALLGQNKGLGIPLCRLNTTASQRKPFP